MNTQPMRLLFLRSEAAKQRLKPALLPGHVDKAMTAPVIAIIAYDLAFHTHLPVTFPHTPAAQAFFEDKVLERLDAVEASEAITSNTFDEMNLNLTIGY